MHTGYSQQYSDFYYYIGGRWLWNEEEQLHDHYKAFHTPELQHIAAESVGAKVCLGIAKVGEGSYNKVFHLTMDNGMAVVARLPNLNADPPIYTNASEVATMDFVGKLHHSSPCLTLVGLVGSPDTSPQGLSVGLQSKQSGTVRIHHHGGIDQKCSVVFDVVTIGKKLCYIVLTFIGESLWV